MLITATGSRYLEYARWQVQHLRAIGWDWPIRVLTDVAGAIVPGAVIERVSPPAGRRTAWWSRGVRVRAYELSPWDLTLCHDADMVPRDIEDVWHFARRGEFCVTINEERPRLGDAWFATPESRSLTLAEAGADSRHYSGECVLFAKSPRAETVYRAWAAEWDRDPTQDEPALARALSRLRESPVEIPIAYNWSPGEYDSIETVMDAYRRERCVHIWAQKSKILSQVYGALLGVTAERATA
jgi:hypothetical protein